MLPRETSIRQLKKLRAETKGTDIGDLTTKDRLNVAIPNMQAIGNPVDFGIESWEEFSQKDSQIQTIAFKSKLVNKSIVKGKKTNEIIGFHDPDNSGRPSYLDVDNLDKTCEKCGIGHYKRKIWKGIVTGLKLKCDNCGFKVERYPEKYGYEDGLKPEKKEKIMKEKLNNVLAFNDFDKNWSPEDAKKTKRTDVAKDIIKEKFYDADDLDTDEEFGTTDDNDKVNNWEDRDVEPSYYEEYDDDDEEDGFDEYDDDDDDFDEDDLDDEDLDDDDLDEEDDEDDLDDDDLDEEEDDVHTFESFTLKDAPKEEKQPEYTILGKEKEPKSNPNFGIGAVKAQEIKKITDFNLIDPVTPKERTIGGNAGVFVDNGTVKGFINRIDGKDVYVESVDNPMKINKFNIKDVVKTKKKND